VRGGVHRRARHGGDGGAQWRRRDGSSGGGGGDGMARLAQGDRGARCQPGKRASNGETTGRWRPAEIASLAPVTGARKALTGRARLPRRERSRGWGVRADGWGRPISGERRGAREGAGPGGRGAWEGARLEMAQPGGRRFFLFLFYFLFLISIFYFYSFISFSFEQIIS
jgi:hypothetical protein